jgi:MYXO-CTERM domain-containing protein
VAPAAALSTTDRAPIVKPSPATPIVVWISLAALLTALSAALLGRRRRSLPTT